MNDTNESHLVTVTEEHVETPATAMALSLAERLTSPALTAYVAPEAPDLHPMQHFLEEDSDSASETDPVNLKLWGEGCLDCSALVPSYAVEGEERPPCHYESASRNQDCPARAIRVVFVGAAIMERKHAQKLITQLKAKIDNATTPLERVAAKQHALAELAKAFTNENVLAEAVEAVGL